MKSRIDETLLWSAAYISFDVDIEERSKSRVPTLFDPNAIELASTLSTELNDECERFIAGGITEARFLADVALASALLSHSSLCRKPVNPHNPQSNRLCSAETSIVRNIIAIIATALGFELDASANAKIDGIFNVRGLEISQAREALQSAIDATLVVGYLKNRNVPAITLSGPIVFINIPSNAPGQAGYKNRAEQLARWLGSIGMQPVVTAQWPPPSGINEAERTAKVLGPMHHASWIIHYTHGGRFGTAQSIALAEDLGIPSLILNHTDADVTRSTRVPGGWTRRQTVKSVNAEQDLRSTKDFVERFRRPISERNKALCTFDATRVHMPPPPASARAGIEPRIFDISWVPLERVHALLEDPVAWIQSPLLVLYEISTKLGLQPRAIEHFDTKIRTDFRRSDEYRQFINGFFAFCRKQNLSHRQISWLMNEYLENARDFPVSALDESSSPFAEDWDSFFGRWDNEEE